MAQEGGTGCVASSHSQKALRGAEAQASGFQVAVRTLGPRAGWIVTPLGQIRVSTCFHVEGGFFFLTQNI